MGTVLDTIEPWSVYIFGPPKCGKTTLAAMAPKPLLIMVDRNGHRSLRRDPKFATILLERCNSWNRVTDAVDKLQRNSSCFGECETIVLDTSSRTQQLSNSQQYKALAKGRKGLSQDEFRETNDRMEQIMTALQDTGKNTIFLAHTKEEKDDAGTTTLIRPANSPTTMSNFNAQVDGIFYMSANGRSDGSLDRRIQSLASGKVLAGSRFEKLPMTINNPDEKFWELLEVS